MLLLAACTPELDVAESPAPDRWLSDADAILRGSGPGANVLGAELGGEPMLVLGNEGDEATPGRVTVAPAPFETGEGWVGASPGDHAGYAIAAYGDRLHVGAFGAGSGGRVYVLADLETQRTLDPPTAGTQFGVALTVLDDALVVGACLADDGGEDSGGAWIYAGEALHRIDGAHPGDAAGSNLGSGDVDGDGADDLLVGAWLDDSAGADAGAAYVLHGPLSGVLSLADAETILTGETAGDFAAAPAGIGGDLTGDGLVDLLVGSWMNGDEAGAVYVVAGTRGGVISLATADAVARGAEGAHLGVVATGAGDADGDGDDDLLVGAPDERPDGAAYLFAGPTRGVLADPERRLAGDEPLQRAGGSVALYDLDGDSLAEVIVGTGVGDAFVFFR